MKAMYSLTYIPQAEFVQCQGHDLTRILTRGAELSGFYKVNIMVADALAPYVARASAAMALTM